MALPKPGRRVIVPLIATVAGATLSAVVYTGGPSATAAPDPCAASEIAKTIGTVATNTGTYLDGHPQTNQALTAIAGQPAGPQSLTAVQSYFGANPQAALDMRALQQPLTTLGTQCHMPVSLPQVLGLLQASQGAQGTGTSGTSAQSMSSPVIAPAQTGQPSAVSAGLGPLPGPSTGATR
jgi:hemophore